MPWFDKLTTGSAEVGLLNVNWLPIGSAICSSARVYDLDFGASMPSTSAME
jgi:hypothetical protein